ncbi:putative U3 small nucleolar RNA-associated protein 7 [Alternaria arborescens]|uniref:putative U3 small nucleolar RNA-associated protein 7 n=1 Tax=Alternaria arborescens TaxID=156630 RepID=UPI0010750A86|nr:putative U3 small nucleolar RNA-associated protein 7 [Alternaria arborescens]RYO35102.1 putative U3 small nucleolar RNA-associated protein 7 [Alternaria arborescens]
MAMERGLKPSTSQPRRKSQNAAPIDDEDTRAVKEFTEAATKQYGRGDRIRPKSVKDKKLRSNIKSLEAKNKQAAIEAKNVEVLLENNPGLMEPENELERTYKVRQDEIKREVGVETAKKSFELRLEGLGPYDVCEYSRNGRDLLIAGRKGHVATFDWRDGKLGCELQLNETVRDARWLHTSNQKNFAVAQKNCVYIYSGDGVEMHKLKNHSEATHLEYLPYHFLLASVSTAGIVRYTDVSTGQSLQQLYTKLGPSTALAQNPHNAILHVGHQKGLVTLWSPNSATPLVKLLPHRGPVRSIAVDRSGTYMVSTSQDRRMSVWDIRMFKEMHQQTLRVPGTTLSISDRNLTAVGFGTQTAIYKDDLFRRNAEDQTPPIMPYMGWGGEGLNIGRVRFCPFEDVLGISHDKGFSSIIVPGSGEPNPDTLEPGTNPYETSKQRRETEVHALLEKIQPEMIALDPNFVGNLDLATNEERQREIRAARGEKEPDKVDMLKKRGKGRNSALRRYLRKSGTKNVIDEEKERAREALKNMQRRQIERKERLKKEYGPALERFARK